MASMRPSRTPLCSRLLSVDTRRTGYGRTLSDRVSLSSLDTSRTSEGSKGVLWFVKSKSWVSGHGVVPDPLGIRVLLLSSTIFGFNYLLFLWRSMYVFVTIKVPRVFPLNFLTFKVTKAVVHHLLFLVVWVQDDRIISFSPFQLQTYSK